MFYPLNIPLKSTDQIKELTKLKSIKLMGTTMFNEKIISYGFTLAENFPFFYFSIRKEGDLYYLITDISTINLNGNEWKDEYIELYLDIANLLADELGTLVNDINSINIKPFGFIHYSNQIKNSNEPSSKIIEMNAMVRNSIIEIIKKYIHAQFEQFKTLTTLINQDDIWLVTLLNTNDNGEFYQINLPPSFKIEKNTSFGGSLYNFLLASFGLPNYKINFIEKFFDRTQPDGTIAKILPIGVFIPFRYLTTDPTQKSYWKKIGNKA